MNKNLTLIIMCLSALLLNGCSKTIFDNQDVRCPFVERGGCQSMNDINRMVSQKRYTNDGLYVQQARQKKRVPNKKCCRASSY